MACCGPRRITGAEGLTLGPHLEALEPALEHGWRIFPCAPRDKNPLLTDWPRRASSNADMISRWAEKYRACNWGLACGPESGVFVLDVDGERGENSLRSLVEQHGTWEKTLTASTARGTHFYFQWPDAETIIRNSASKIGAGIDVRGRRGYVLCPPSIHPSGTPYEWTAVNLQAARAPGWLLESLTSAARPVIEASEIGILPEGQRNDGLTRLAGALRRKGKNQSEIEAELLAANVRRCRPPLLDTEVRKIAASVSRYAPGGLDPLEAAWQATQGDCGSNYEQFLALAAHLQEQRPGQPVALPLERIASLLRVHWNSVSYYRSKAVASGILSPAGDYVPHRRAGLYRVSEEKLFVTKTIVTSGLVTNRNFPLVTNSPSYKEQDSPSYKESLPLVTKASEREISPALQESENPPVSCDLDAEKKSAEILQSDSISEGENSLRWEPPTFTVLSKEELAEKVRRSMAMAGRWGEIAGRVQ